MITECDRRVALGDCLVCTNDPTPCFIILYVQHCNISVSAFWVGFNSSAATPISFNISTLALFVTPALNMHLTSNMFELFQNLQNELNFMLLHKIFLNILEMFCLK